ncbi:MAG TPA: hypothetical protein VFZ65_10495 [Planctomycetota bacterium]|nr:hypothetical protein [Planctomycetota bacterium]
MLFLHNTSHVDDEPYPKLLSEKGFTGFPSICFMDVDGNVLSKPQRSVKAFVETLAQTKVLVALRAKGDKATPAEKKQLFLAELELGMIPANELEARAAKVPDLDKEQKALVAQKLVDAEVSAVLRKARELGADKVGESLADMAKKGRVPSDVMAGSFWPQVLQHASKQKDARLAQQAYDALMVRYASEKGDRFEKVKAAWQKLVEEARTK